MEKMVITKPSQIDAAYWQGRRVLVTGHSGFKGSWLTIWLNQLGSQITGLGLKPSNDPTLFELPKFQSCAKATLPIFAM